MPPISVMIKPASSSCNLRCRYCFYHDVSSLRHDPSRGRMSYELLENILRKMFDFSKGQLVSLSFQGGEPLLAGKDFFRKASELIKKYNVYNSPIQIGIQTNGTLIDEEWCEIFHDNRFLVGLSLDGDKIANSNRIDANGEEVFDRVLNAAKMLQDANVTFNILSVLTKGVANRIDEIYNFYKSNGLKNLQFIPCLKPLDGTVTEDFYLTSKDYENFLTKGFYLYTQDYIKGNYISIRQFDNFVHLAHFKRAEQCGMNGHCTHQYVIEADGEVFPCDFYCLDEYSLGFIQNQNFEDLEKNPVAINFIKESCSVEEKCKSCNFYALCRGGCKREKLDVDKCVAYKRFFPFAIPYLKRMS